MRVAIVHEWLETYAGSERVTEQLLSMFPCADLFSLVDFLPAWDQRSFLQGRKPKTSSVQRLPFARKRFAGLPVRSFPLPFSRRTSPNTTSRDLLPATRSPKG